MLLADLLEISRFDAGAAVLDLEDVNLVRRRAPGRGVHARRWRRARGTVVVVRTGDRPCVAEVDARRVERIVRNLVTNAIDYADSERRRRARRRRRRAPPRSTVRDHGVGLQPGEAAMVFNRFWRADPARARTTGGTGLGLSISLEDAQLHGGWLQAWGEPGRRRAVPADAAAPARATRSAPARCRWCPTTPARQVGGDARAEPRPRPRGRTQAGTP